MNEISSSYGILYLIFSGIIGMYFLWKLIIKPENQPIRGIRGSKWSTLCWLYVIILGIESAILILVSNFSLEIINYRIIPYPFVNAIDVIFICHIFLSLLFILSRVEMQTTGDRAGKFVVGLNSTYEIPLVILFLPAPPLKDISGHIGTIGILILYILAGVSIILVILSLLPIILTKKIFETASAY